MESILLQTILTNTTSRERYIEEGKIIITIELNFRMKNLKDGPYTQADAEAAVGLKTDNGIRSRDRVAMDVVETMQM